MRSAVNLAASCCSVDAFQWSLTQDECIQQQCTSDLPAAAATAWFVSVVSSPLLIADCELWSYRLGGPHPGGSLHHVDVLPVATSVFHPTADGI